MLSMYIGVEVGLRKSQQCDLHIKQTLNEATQSGYNRNINSRQAQPTC